MTNSIKVSSAGTKTAINASTPQNYYDGLSKQWAINDGIVQGQDYSSKYYAEKSKEEFAKVQSEVTKAQGASNEAQSYANLANGIIEDGKTAIAELEQQAEINIENKKDELSLELKNEKTTYLNEVKTASQTAINTYSNVLTKSQITNCVLEVPQTINLEIVNGELILKKGSTFILPNGVGNFERITTTTDLKRASFGTYVKADLYIQIYRANSTGADSLSFARPEIVVCGATQPEVGKMWYDTTNNKIYNINSTGIENAIRSFPFAIVAVENGVPIEIKQIFNGLGYFGNTIFADKGIKGLIPNGRNADGTLNNIEFETQSVLTQTRNIDGKNMPIILNAVLVSNYAVANYDENANMVFASNGTQIKCAIVGTWSADNTGRFTKIDVKQPFRAVDYYDFKEVKEKQDEIKRYVIEKSPKSLLPSWYTVYSDGWIEQGGETTILGLTSTTLTLLKAYTTVTYFATASWTNVLHNEAITVKSRTETTLDLDCGSTIQDTACWYACGY